MLNWKGALLLELRMYGSSIHRLCRHHQRHFFPPMLLDQRVRVSRPRSLLLILSHSCGGRDENDCLIMQRGQPIKGPGGRVI